MQSVSIAIPKHIWPWAFKAKRAVAAGTVSIALIVSPAAWAQSCPQVRDQLFALNQELLQQLVRRPTSTLCALAGAGTVVEALTDSLSTYTGVRDAMRGISVLCVGYCAFATSANCAEQMGYVLASASRFSALTSEERRLCPSS